MPRVALSASTALTDPALTAVSKGGTPDASDAAQGNSFANTGDELIVVDNVGASSRTVTFRNAADTANLGVVTVAANKMQLIGPFDPTLYGTTVDFVSSHAELESRVFSLTGGGLSNVITRR